MSVDVDRGPISDRALAHPGLGASVACLTHRNLLLYSRNPLSFMGAVVFPLIFFAGFSLVLWRMLDARGVDAAQFLPPAIVVQAMLLTAMSSATFLAGDAGRGLLERLRVMSVPRLAVITGRLAADSVRSLVSIVVVLAVGFIVGLRFEHGPLAGLGFVTLALLTSLTFIAGAGAIGLKLADAESTSALLGLPYLPLLMLSSAFVPADQFPGWLQPVITWSPISASIDGLRALITAGAPTEPLWRAIGWLTILLPLFLLLAARAYRRAS